jgi:hypothetical protein
MGMRAALREEGIGDEEERDREGGGEKVRGDCFFFLREGETGFDGSDLFGW